MGTPCGDSGVCFEHARWRTPRELAVRVEPRLQPGTTYTLTLGSASRGRPLISCAGQPLPVSRWRFTTASR